MMKELLFSVRTADGKGMLSEMGVIPEPGKN
jgi:hypothetical protein